MTREPETALILSGGGARGAYAVGVVQALLEILAPQGRTSSPFRIFSGTSVGSINTAYLVANAHRHDLGIRELRQIWTDLDVNTHLRLRGTRKAPFNLRSSLFLSDSLLDARPLELLVRRSMSFDDLNRNLQDGVAHAALVAAFDLYSAMGPSPSWHGLWLMSTSSERSIKAFSRGATSLLPTSRRTGRRIVLR
jgi:NTE family protein